ncbi:RluA family pseudouridine synthase [soil metagenome]
MPSPETELLTATAEPGDAGERLDRWLAARFPAISRARFQTLIANGGVEVESGAVRETRFRVKPGMSVTVRLPPPTPPKPQGEILPLSILFEDGDLIVIDKPAGLVVHPAAGHGAGTLVNALIAHCGASLSGIGGVMRPGIVHRLDKDTSGLLVVAKNDRAHQGLAEQFASHGLDGRLEREYVAFAWGTLARRRGAIDAPLARSPTNRQKIAVSKSTAARRAVTHYEVVQTFGKPPVASEVRCRLETGRTHQIRVHLAYIGHPLMGDETYATGYKSSNSKLSSQARDALVALGRQALHAALLGFDHPVSGKHLRFQSDLPADMNALKRSLLT